jgi:ribosome-binding factor A
VSGEAHKRAQRVGQLVQKELAQMLVNELKDPRIGFATITEVRMTDDLKLARVYVSVYGDDKVREDTLLGLRAAAGFMRREIASRLDLRSAPTLSFQTDATLEKATRIDALLSAAAHGETDLPGHINLEPVPVQTLRSEKPAARPSRNPARKKGAGKRRSR